MESIIKVVITGKPYDLEMFEAEPGILEIFVKHNEDEQSGGFIQVPTETFKRALEKLLSK